MRKFLILVLLLVSGPLWATTISYGGAGSFYRWRFNGDTCTDFQRYYADWRDVTYRDNIRLLKCDREVLTKGAFVVTFYDTSTGSSFASDTLTVEELDNMTVPQLFVWFTLFFAGIAGYAQGRRGG